MFLYHALRREGILPIIEHIEAIEDFLDSCDDFDFDFDEDFDFDFYDENFEVFDFDDYDFEEVLH